MVISPNDNGMNPTIKPSNINTDEYFDSRIFHYWITNKYAQFLVRFCTQRDNTWGSFSHDEFKAWSDAHANAHDLDFNMESLVIGKWVEQRSGETNYTISDRFIKVAFAEGGKFKRPENN